MYKTEIEYWEERSAQRMWKHMENAEKISKEISKSYLKASQYLDQQIDEVFLRFKNKHELSTVEAKRLLNMMHDSTSIQSLKLALQQSKDSEEKAELLKMLESPAYSARIKRFEEMQEQLDVIMNNVYQTEKSLSTKHYVDLASDSYYCSIFDIQKGTGVGFQFAHVSQDEIDKLLHSNWSGINYTHRIWGNTNRLAKTLKEEMLVSLMTGRSNLATAEVFREKFNVGAFEARRLIRTESAYIVNEMEQQAYEECDIEKYMFVATLDKRTSEICQKKDHKVYAVKERAQGVNCLHMHPFCRSTTIAYLDDETISNMERLATDDETGEKNIIPADLTYKDWFDGHKKHGLKLEEWNQSHFNRTGEKGYSNGVINRSGSNKVDMQYIESEEYRRKFTQITENSEVNQKIRQTAKAILTHRKGTDFEDTYIIDLSTGRTLIKEVSSKEPLTVTIKSDDFKRAIKGVKGRIIGIHNHPTNMPPSGADFVAAGSRGYDFGLVITHSGEIYWYKTGNQAFLPQSIDLRVEKKIEERYNENIIEAHECALDDAKEVYGIQWGKLK